tara:strand:- start:281 stop:403 length:123 start_codon:yes stop_codon:yes gene_type:complete
MVSYNDKYRAKLERLASEKKKPKTVKTEVKKEEPKKSKLE